MSPQFFYDDSSMCGTRAIERWRRDNSIEYRLAREAITSQRMAALALAATSTPTLKVKVCVHIVAAKPKEPVWTPVIEDQLATLNWCFSGHFGGLDAGIEFSLERITFTSSEFVFSLDDETRSSGPYVKSKARGGHSPVKPTEWLNVWVCRYGSHGFGSHPGASADSDGVVVGRRAFGTMALDIGRQGGKTLAHEVGHWLDLYHPWCRTYAVADVPVIASSHASPPFVCCATTGHSPENLMDYSHDDIRTTFSAEQIKLMRSTLRGPRAAWVV